MKFATLIPIRFNDGREVSEEQMQEIIDGLAIEFGGCSDEGITKGQWIDPQESIPYRDECRRVSVVCLGASAVSPERIIGEESMGLQKAKLQEALEFVKREADAGATATDLHNAFFGIGGKFGELFPQRSEREAFRKTSEYEQIKQIRASLRAKERVGSS